MDIRDKAGMLALFEAEKFDVVYNIAGIAPLPDCQSDPVQAIEVNTLGLVNLLEAGRRTGIKQLVQASTNAMYENETEFPTVESKFNRRRSFTRTRNTAVSALPRALPTPMA